VDREAVIPAFAAACQPARRFRRPLPVRPPIAPRSPRRARPDFGVKDTPATRRRTTPCRCRAAWCPSWRGGILRCRELACTSFQTYVPPPPSNIGAMSIEFCSLPTWIYHPLALERLGPSPTRRIRYARRQRCESAIAEWRSTSLSVLGGGCFEAFLAGVRAFADPSGMVLGIARVVSPGGGRVARPLFHAAMRRPPAARGSRHGPGSRIVEVEKIFRFPARFALGGTSMCSRAGWAAPHRHAVRVAHRPQ